MTELKTIIIEDEQKAAADLASELSILDPGINVIVTLDSVAGSVHWLKEHPMPDLVFMDIHLGDGSCFEIFRQVQLTCPVIFCTAYDEYAIEAFNVNGIGYIVKPIARDVLANALRKYRELKKHYTTSSPLSAETIARILHPEARYKTSFLLPFRSKMVPLPVSSIAYIYVNHEQTCLVTQDQQLILNKTLDQLQQELNPDHFYRINRQYIVSFKYIKEIEHLSGRKLGVHLTIPVEELIIVSKENSSSFKAWLEKR
jgi:DNA-binding LytR/AlgR family response regulator